MEQPFDLQEVKAIKEYKAKRRLVDFQIFSESDLPVRIVKKRNGSKIASFETVEQAEEYIAKLPESALNNKVTRKVGGRVR